MHSFSHFKFSSVICIFLVTAFFASVTGAPLNWTNDDSKTVYNGPDKPTYVTFNDCVQVISINTYHWNYGKGDTPGKIRLFHEDGTEFGPWPVIAENGTDGAVNAVWISRPGELLKPGTYLVSDSNPATWSQNDGSDNRGIATIIYEPGYCMNESGNTSNGPDDTIPEGFSDAVTLHSEVSDPATLEGGATERDEVPILEQINLTPLSRNINGGQNLYAILRVKNVGDRDLEDGYVSVRLISQDGLFAYQGGIGKLPLITAGEERDIGLIIQTEKPRQNGDKSNTLFCGVYSLDGSIKELMKGGYFESRGLIALSRDKLIRVTGCCQEPYTENSIRICGTTA